MPAKKSICSSPAVVAVASAIIASESSVVKSSQKYETKNGATFCNLINVER